MPETEGPRIAGALEYAPFGGLLLWKTVFEAYHAVKGVFVFAVDAIVAVTHELEFFTGGGSCKRFFQLGVFHHFQ